MAESDSTSTPRRPPEGARIVPGFPDYCIRIDGRVFSRKIAGSGAGRIGPWRQLKAKLPPKGKYLYVALYCGNKRKHYNIHALVMLVFVGPRPKGMDIRHLDGNRLNNHLDNLCYGTRKENAADAIRHGTKPLGERAPNAVLTTADVQEIRRLRAEGLLYRQIGEKFGIHPGHVGLICRGTVWKRT